MSSTRPRREGRLLRNQMCAQGDRAEDLGAEQAVALGLEGAIVNRLGLLHLAERPRPDLLGRRQSDLDRVEVFVGGELLEKVE
jgi:hypothetical protein